MALLISCVVLALFALGFDALRRLVLRRNAKKD
jgi:hypothetical protein